MDDKTIPLKTFATRAKKQPLKKKKTWDVDSFGNPLFEQTGECVFIIGLDLHYLAANRQALLLLGYDENELIGKSVSDVMSMEELLEQQPGTAESVNLYERILKRKDGALVPVEVSASLVSDQNGEPAYIQSIVRDITDRKKTERYLKRSGRILSVISEATARFLAIPIQGTLGSWGFLGLFDRENSLSWLPADFNTIQTAANLIGAALQRIQYEETIRLNESRNRAIVDTLPDLLIRVNSAGMILDYSSNPDHPLYIHRDMIAGKKLDQALPDEVLSRN